MQKMIPADRLAHPDGEVRRIAILELEYSDEEDFTAIAAQALSDPDARLRAEAAAATPRPRRRPWRGCTTGMAAG